FRAASTEDPCISTGTPPTVTRPGFTITVTGERFGASEVATLRWDDPNASPLTTATATGTGTISKAISVPSGTRIGPHKVLASAPSGSAEALLFVVPTITCIDPAIGAQGTLVTLTGKDFGPAQGGTTVNFTGGSG